MSPPKSSFWTDLADDLDDPEFRTEYIRQSIRIATVDRIVAALDEAREAAGLSKAALARAIGADPAAVRRLFSAEQVNPTLGTLSELAAALGMEVVLAPLPDDLRTSLTEPLLGGEVADTAVLARQLAALRHRSLAPA